MARLTPEQRQALETARRISPPPLPPPPPPPMQAAVAPGPPKRKIWPWVVGCGCLLPLVVLALLFALGVQSTGGMAAFNKRAAEERAKRAAERDEQRELEQRGREAAEVARQAERKAAKASAISAVDLVTHYDANEVAADQAYKGKDVAVNGTVDKIGKDMTGTMYVTLKGPDTSFRNVQCFFEFRDKGALASLSPGQRLTLRGRCKGLMMNVLLEKCEIL
jgi:hypothetical protein